MLNFDMEEVMEIEATFGKSARKPSDMNAPKRPLSAYFQWANKMRPTLLKDNPSWGVSDVGKKLGKMWKNVDSTEKAGFESKYEKEKKTYDAKMEKYTKSANYKKFQMHLLAYKIHATKKPFPADDNAPKRPVSAYMMYAASVRSKILKENPDMEVSDVMKEQSVWWKALSDSERAPWVKKAEAARAAWQKKVERYQKTSDYQTYCNNRDEYKAEMLAKRNKLMGIKKRARSEGAPEKAKKAKRSGSKKKKSARHASTPRSAK